MTPELELEAILIRQIDAIKSDIPRWDQPEHLAEQLGMRVHYDVLGDAVEGATFDDVIVLDPHTGVQSRHMFTFYHEIVHQLIRRNDELYSVIHDQYQQEEGLTRILERLANVGAAEFLVPRSLVRAGSESWGYTMRLVNELHVPGRVSPTAVCVQLGLCAPHRCIAVVGRVTTTEPIHLQSQLSSGRRTHLVVEVATSSRSTKYVVAKGTSISSDHLMRHALDAEPGMILTGRATIPFRRALRPWEVQCEVTRIGYQVFALFHLDSPPGKLGNQMRFDI
jgi:Zn-dependent peptidase ImmA (M78 family)